RRDRDRIGSRRRDPGAPPGAYREEDPAARTRRLRPPGEGQLGAARRQPRRKVPDEGNLEGSERRRSASAHELPWEATPSSMARPCSGCARKTSARFAITAAFHPRGPSRTTSSSRTTPAPSACITCPESAEKTLPTR